MADTLLLAFLIFVFFIVLSYALIKGNKLSGKRILFSLGLIFIAIIAVFIYSGSEKIKADLSRIIHNASPKSPMEIYAILFEKPLDSCVNIVNLKDQVIPKVDCCIWMEVKICPAELNRIVHSKNYVKSDFTQFDSSIFLQPFYDRPKWWTPQLLSGGLTKLNIVFNQDNQQSIFFGADSTHVFICDQAL